MPQATQSTLRAVFAGIGRILSVTDKVRNKPAAAEAPASSPAPETAAPETTASEPVVPEAAAPEPAAAEPEAPQAEAAEPEAPEAEAEAPRAEAPASAEPEPEATAEPEAAADLPLPNYEQLTIASVRARLRNLSVAQLGTLIEHEKAHGARKDFISMFERRMAKVESEK